MTSLPATENSSKWAITPLRIDRFWSYVNRGDGCWTWTAALCSGGYGVFNVGGKTDRAHRISVVLSGRSIPRGMHVDHMCKNRSCVNPDHLEVVPPAVNSMRSAHAEKTVCKNGHPYTPENTHIRDNGGRSCRRCGTARNRLRKRARLFIVRVYRNCTSCGWKYLTSGKWRTQKYCSRECGQKVRMRKHLSRKFYAARRDV